MHTYKKIIKFLGLKTEATKQKMGNHFSADVNWLLNGLAYNIYFSQNESGGNRKESPGKEVDMVRTCDEKIEALCRKEGDGNESTEEKEERKA